MTNPFTLFYLLIAIALPIGMAKVIGHLSRKLVNDPGLDEYIKEQAFISLAKQIDRGMDKPDWRKIDRAGSRVWQQKLQGQRRYNQPSAILKRAG